MVLFHGSTAGTTTKGIIMNEGMENLKEIQDLEERSINPLIRIADALEEILRLVKADQEKMEKRRLREPDDVTGELWSEKN